MSRSSLTNRNINILNSSVNYNRRSAIRHRFNLRSRIGNSVENIHSPSNSSNNNTNINIWSSYFWAK